jgi:hypothetical protein
MVVQTVLEIWADIRRGRGARQRNEEDDAEGECDDADERRPEQARPAAQRPEDEQREPDEQERRADAEPGNEPECDKQQRRDPVAHAQPR